MGINNKSMHTVYVDANRPAILPDFAGAVVRVGQRPGKIGPNCWRRGRVGPICKGGGDVVHL